MNRAGIGVIKQAVLNTIVEKSVIVNVRSIACLLPVAVNRSWYCYKTFFGIVNKVKAKVILIPSNLS